MKARRKPKPELEPKTEKRWAAFCPRCGWLHVQPAHVLKACEVVDGIAHVALQHRGAYDVACHVIHVEVRPMGERRRNVITSEQARDLVKLVLAAENVMPILLTQLRHYPGDVGTRKAQAELHEAIYAIRERR